MQAKLRSCDPYVPADSVVENQLAQEREESLARLLLENQALVTEMEHLRTILSHKDQMIAEVRQAPQALMAELVRLRQKCDEATAHGQWVEAERDAAQFELARRSLAHGQAEEELRRLRHHSEQLERLLAIRYDAGAELAKLVQEKSGLAVNLAQAREKLAALRQQLGSCLKGMSLLVIELGGRVYALRAAVARWAEAADFGSADSLHQALDQIMAHLDDSNEYLRGLRELDAVTEAELQR